MGADRLKEACESLDRLVDIDPYDYRNHERIAKLEGKADPGFLQNILARAAKAATVSTRTDGFTGAGREPSENAPGVPEEVRAQQALEDLVVQVEIFLQYSLQSKAVERLERIAELFPGEEDRNERCVLCTNARTGGRKAGGANPRRKPRRHRPHRWKLHLRCSPHSNWKPTERSPRLQPRKRTETSRPSRKLIA